MPEIRVDYSIVIPTYRGAANLKELIERITQVMKILGKTYEIILRDDDSPDNRWKVITKLKDNYPLIHAFRLMHNVGQFRALMCAFEQVQGAYVITMDDDLQNPPEEIPKLINCMEDNPEMDGIIGAYEHKQHSFWRQIGSFMVHIANRLVSHKPATLQTTSFRLLRRHMVEAISLHKTMSPVMGPLDVQNSRRIINVTVEHHPRKKGKSNYSFIALMRLALDHIFNFSTLPLKIVSIIGMLSSCASVLLGVFYLIQFLAGNIGVNVKGWTTLVLLLIFYSGLILFSLGLMGEYLIRIIREVSHSPRYIIRDML